MHHAVRRAAVLATLVATIAACGGGNPPPATPGPAGAAEPGEAVAPASPREPAPAPAPVGDAAATPPGPGAPPAPASAKTAPPAPDSAGDAFPRGAKVLIIGDSFAQSLGLGLKKLEDELGVKFVLEGEQATYIPEWAGSKRDVPGKLRFHKPDLVIISLGGNELAMVDPTVRGPRVKELVGHMGQTPCIWVAPALWGNKETGLLDVIKKNSSPCRHFDSNRLTPELPRGGDKIHPNLEGQRRWAKALVDWIRVERDRSVDTFGLKPRPSEE